MSRVDDEQIDSRIDECVGALLGVRADTHGSADHEPTRGILGGQGVLVGLDEVLDGEESAETAVGVNEWQLLDLVAREQAQGILGLHADGRCQQRHRGHDLAHSARHVVFEPHIAVGDDADKPAGVVDDGHAADAVATAQRIDLGQGRIGAAGDGVAHHAGLGTLDHVDLRRLIVDRQVAVQDADTALACHGDGQTPLGDGVHGARQKGHAHRQIAGHTTGGVDLAGHDIGLGRQQQHIVEREPEVSEGLRKRG